MAGRMSGRERRSQVLGIAAGEFADHGLHGASTEADRPTGRDHPGLHLPDVRDQEGPVPGGDGGGVRPHDRGHARGRRIRDRARCAQPGWVPSTTRCWPTATSLLLQLQGFAACGDPEVRDAVRASFGRMWQMVAETTGLDPVTIKAFLAFGMLLNNGAALQVAELDEPWARGVRTPDPSRACSTTSPRTPTDEVGHLGPTACTPNA